MTHSEVDYHVLIVRAWSVQPTTDEEPAWRYTIEIPNTKQRFGFASMQSLFEALACELGAIGSPGDGDGDPSEELTDDTV